MGMKPTIGQFFGAGLTAFLFGFLFLALLGYLFGVGDFLVENWGIGIGVLVFTWGGLLYLFSFHQDKKWVKKLIEFCTEWDGA